MVFDVLMKRLVAWGKFGKSANRIIFWVYCFLFFKRAANKTIDQKMPLGFGIVAENLPVESI